MFDQRAVFDDVDDPIRPFLLISYIASIVVLWIYSLSKWKNLFYAVMSTRCFTDNPSNRAGQINIGEEPHVTIQITTFNEGQIVVETISRACSVDWPRDKLTIQILDDSTDDLSKSVIAGCVAWWLAQEIDIQHLTRQNRVGYKAGSLRFHFDAIKSDYVAHLDADHRIEPNFLRRAMPFFFDKNGKSRDEIGLVQAPWGFYNIGDNLLTELDSLSLDIHHVVEQTGRDAAHHCFSFNGTGGIWRRQAIKAAGGWSWESVTEDLALSYMAALERYKFVYVRDMPQLLEVPANFQAYIQQKSRWTKGFFQVFRFYYWKILMSRNLSVGLKFEAFCHFTSSVQYSILAYTMYAFPFLVLHGLASPILMLSTSLVIAQPLVAAVITCFAKVSGSNGIYKSFRSRVYRLRLILPYCALGCGMSFFETKAMLEGLLSNDATFLTTPKDGSGKKGTKAKSRNEVKALFSDDFCAMCGIFLCVHRLIFFTEAERAGNCVETFLLVLNEFLYFALFWVNAGFLNEKYKFHKGLRRLSNSSRSLILIYMLLLGCYSKILSMAFLHRDVLPKQIDFNEFQFISTSSHRGVYFMANEKFLNMTVAFLNSFRFFNPTIPLVCIPYDEFSSKEIHSLALQYNFQLYFDRKLFKHIDDTTSEIEGVPSHLYRKLAIWSGPFDEFLYLDSDSVVLDSVDFVWPLLQHADVANGISKTKENKGYGNSVSKRTVSDSAILTAEPIDCGAQTGVILSSRRLASTEELLNKTVNEALKFREHFKSGVQSLLDFLIVSSGKRYNSFLRMTEDEGMTTVPKLALVAEDAQKHGGVIATPDNRIRWTRGMKNKPIFFFHWAGNKNRSSEMPFINLWQYWHDLKPPQQTVIRIS